LFKERRRPRKSEAENSKSEKGNKKECIGGRIKESSSIVGSDERRREERRRRERVERME
jgi:hypothetical protein